MNKINKLNWNIITPHKLKVIATGQLLYATQ